MTPREQRSKAKIARELADHLDVAYVSISGSEYREKPGRRKRITQDEAALVFALMVESAAANRTISRVLVAAGYVTKGAQSRILTLLWRDRGRTNIMRTADGKMLDWNRPLRTGFR